MALPLAWLAAFCGAALCGTATAVPEPTDPRLREVVYDPGAVVTVPVIVTTLPSYLCADAPDNQQVLIPVIIPFTDVVSAEVGGVDVRVVGVLDFDEGGLVVMGAPVLPPGTYEALVRARGLELLGG